MGDQAHAATTGGCKRSSPLAVKPPQFPAKAKRVIFLFMHGGPSQVDTFDYKPLLSAITASRFHSSGPKWFRARPSTC